MVSVPNGTLIEAIYLKSEKNRINKNAYLGNSGIFVIKKFLLDKICPPKKDETKSVFHFLVKNIFSLDFNIFSYNTTEYIKDMGTPKRLEIVQKDYQKIRLIGKIINFPKSSFLDRDNTLLNEIGKYIINKNEIEFIKENIKKIVPISKI